MKDKEILNLILKERKLRKITWDILAKDLPISGNALRLAFKRGSVSTIYIETICEKLDISYIQQENKKTSYNLTITPLINKYSYSEFLDKNSDLSYIESLPKFSWNVDLEYNDYPLTFEMKGDSMEDGTYLSLLSEDLLLAVEFAKKHWKNESQLQQHNFIILHKIRGIFVCRIVEVKNDSIMCHFLNSYYEDIEISFTDVVKVFKVVKLYRNGKF